MDQGKTVVLVVEDDKDALSSYTEIVSDAGHKVYSAPDGYVGLKLLQEHKNEVDVILLDLMMPGVDGLEFLTKIKADTKTYGKPHVIVLSALSSESVVKEVFNKGADGYLLKAELEENDILEQIAKVTGKK